MERIYGQQNLSGLWKFQKRKTEERMYEVEFIKLDQPNWVIPSALNFIVKLKFEILKTR